MGRRAYITPVKVFDTLEEMAKEFGVTAGALSRAITDRREYRGVPVFVAERIFLCRLRKGGWIVAAKDSRGKALVPVEQGAKVRLSEVEEMRDISISWFFGKIEKLARNL